MDKLQQLYNLYLDQGIITEAVSFEEFSNINENQQQQLFDLGKQSGLFVTATIEDFSNSWPKVEPEPVTSTRADVRERDLKKKIRNRYWRMVFRSNQNNQFRLV